VWVLEDTEAIIPTVHPKVVPVLQSTERLHLDLQPFWKPKRKKKQKKPKPKKDDAPVLIPLADGPGLDDDWDEFAGFLEDYDNADPGDGPGDGPGDSPDQEPDDDLDDGPEVDELDNAVVDEEDDADYVKGESELDILLEEASDLLCQPCGGNDELDPAASVSSAPGGG